MDIPFTQFMRPNGRKVPATIDRPEPIAAIAEKIRAMGCWFEIEVLMTGEISMEIVRMVQDRENEQDEPERVASEVVPNGPEVPEAVDRLVMSAKKALRIP